MANQTQVDRIWKNVAGWNTWRGTHPAIRPDLSYANLSYANLSYANLNGADLNEADLNGANLNGANLRDANLSRANLIGAHLIGTDLNIADLIGANLSEANLSGANLSRAHLSRANLSRAHLSRAHLNGAYLNGAHLIGVDLIGANLSDADLSGANLIGVDFSGANLSGAILIGTDLSGANLSDADLSRARVSWTVFGNCDLQTVKGLEQVVHHGPSTVGINTIYKSGGNIPEVFLRGTGAPDIFIEYMQALTARPIEYYTCFISYSSENREFAERLYTDLQANNVRCWYSPEDMKIGDQIRQRIDDSIHVYDKLLLILSSESVMSQWVETEVETALEKEQQHNQTVLFPVRIDEMVMHAVTPWASTIQNTRHIGDFTQWKDYDAYQKGLQRLLRDLKQGK